MTTIRTYALRALAALSALVLPVAAFAQSTVNTKGADRIGEFLLLIVYVIDRYLVPVIFALAFIIFIIGVYRYFVLGGANEEKRQEGQKFVMWGIIGFVLMFSVWGVINLLVGTLGLGGQNRPDLPTFDPAHGTVKKQTGSAFGNGKNTTATGDASVGTGGSAFGSGSATGGTGVGVDETYAEPDAVY